MDGATPLTGSISTNGSKNASLPLMAAALLTDEPLHLSDVPDLADTRNMLRLLAELGCNVSERPAGRDATTIHSTDDSASTARYEIVRTMRGSICTLGPMLARRGHARIAMPGGCAIGDRPVDLHLRGLRALGAEISLDSGDMIASAPRGGLMGASIFLGGASGPTVLGTANVMSAATLAHGETIIESAACEPEITDLAKLLNSMGAQISGAGSPRITIRGVRELSGASHRVIPDRIEAGTFLMLGALHNADLTVENCPLDALMAVCDRLDRIGVEVHPTEDSPNDTMRATVRITRRGALQATRLTTQPHPGFPTDLQAQAMALLCTVNGHSIITERIFPERFLHVPELSRMGAQIFRQGPTAVVSGVDHLVGAPVMASDLRASASLVLAGLAAQGQTIVRRVYHLDRGYASLEDRLVRLGAQIQRVDDKELAPIGV
jgi:UDP-N-acetylglucosamine 1-carboxyvinyltransferase